MSRFDALAQARTRLLTVIAALRADDLDRSTRNADWRVADVLAHVLASDADLLSLLGAEAERTHETKASHDAEMARWSRASLAEINGELRSRCERGSALFGSLTDAELESPARAWWNAEAQPLGHIVDDYLPHDDEHAEDIRLAAAPSET